MFGWKEVRRRGRDGGNCCFYGELEFVLGGVESKGSSRERTRGDGKLVSTTKQPDDETGRADEAGEGMMLVILVSERKADRRRDSDPLSKCVSVSLHFFWGGRRRRRSNGNNRRTESYL